MPENKWTKFVKEWAMAHNLRYGCALGDPEMRAEYHKSKTIFEAMPEEEYIEIPVKAKKTKKLKKSVIKNLEQMGQEDIRSQIVRTADKRKQLLNNNELQLKATQLNKLPSGRAELRGAVLQKQLDEHRAKLEQPEEEYIEIPVKAKKPKKLTKPKKVLEIEQKKEEEIPTKKSNPKQIDQEFIKAKQGVKEGVYEMAKSDSGKQTLLELGRLLKGPKATKQVIGTKTFEVYEPIEDIISRQFNDTVEYYLTYITKEIPDSKDTKYLSKEHRKSIIADYIADIIETKKMDKALLKRIRESRYNPHLKEYIKTIKIRGK